MLADGLVERRQLSPVSAGVRYSVTAYGRTLGPVLETLWRWGTVHLARGEAAHGTRRAPPRQIAEKIVLRS
jgi:DNA-binding HxlR family transcriptional regulator